MNRWIADFFEMGHPLENIHQMNYWTYIELITEIGSNRAKAQGKSYPRELRPKQQDMINKRKEMDKR